MDKTYYSLEEEHLLQGKDDNELLYRSQHSLRPTRSWKCLSLTLLPIFSFSLVVNFLLMRRLPLEKSGSFHDGKTIYAGLEWNVETMYEVPSDSIPDPGMEWEYIWPDIGVVAIEDSEVARTGLPVGQRFPWDDNKGLYFLGAYHSLHCLQNVATAIFDYRDGKSQTFDEWHTLHCLRSLRSDIECFADDTPRYTSEQYAGHSGTNQKRTCRDMSKLNAWASERSACWHYLGIGENEFDTLLRYRYCPPGSPYHERIKELWPDLDTDFNSSVGL